MWVESTVGEGTVFHFTVTLPVRSAPARRAGPREFKGLRVLVVDDNAMSRRILRAVLAGWRMEPEVAATGEAAMAELLAAARAGNPFQLVILDDAMPGMNGFRVAEKAAETLRMAYDGSRFLGENRLFWSMGGELTRGAPSRNITSAGCTSQTNRGLPA